MNPYRHHLTNLFFHIASTLVLLTVSRKMSGKVFFSGFVAAAFGLHPMHVESVAWIAERKDVLSGFFWMLTMWAYVYYVERPKFAKYRRDVVFVCFGAYGQADGCDFTIRTAAFGLLAFVSFWQGEGVLSGQRENTFVFAFGNLKLDYFCGAARKAGRSGQSRPFL